MATAVVLTVALSGALAWRLLWPAAPGDRGLAAMTSAYPEWPVECLIRAIEDDPGEFRVDEGFYFANRFGTAWHSSITASTGMRYDSAGTDISPSWVSMAS